MVKHGKTVQLCSSWNFVCFLSFLSFLSDPVHGPHGPPYQTGEVNRASRSVTDEGVSSEGPNKMNKHRQPQTARQNSHYFLNFIHIWRSIAAWPFRFLPYHSAPLILGHLADSDTSNYCRPLRVA